MKVLTGLLAFLSVVAVGQTRSRTQADPFATLNQTSTFTSPNRIVEPMLTSARLKGNKLIVTGENFDQGATIFWGMVLCNEQTLGTRNDTDSPSTTLISKKAGKYLPFDKYFALVVQNSNGETSFCLEYLRNESFWALALPGALYPYAVHIRVGDYLVVRYLGLATRWFADTTIVNRVSDLPVPSANDWLFQAVRPGGFRFYAEIASRGEVPPMVLYSNGIVVEWRM